MFDSVLEKLMISHDVFHLSQEVKSYPVQWIKVVEKIAFHRKHMFQLVVIPSSHIYSSDTPSQVNLYLQAAVSGY